MLFQNKEFLCCQFYRLWFFLRHIKSIILLATSQKLLMGAHLCNSTIFEHDNFVSIFNSINTFNIDYGRRCCIYSQEKFGDR